MKQVELEPTVVTYIVHKVLQDSSLDIDIWKALLDRRSFSHHFDIDSLLRIQTEIIIKELL